MIKLASPDIRETDINRVVEVLKSENLVQGKYVSELENKLAEFTRIANCTVVSSGTAALHLALTALGIKVGDYVIVPAFTFPATANVVENLGANVILCDVEPKSYVATPEVIEEAIKQNLDKPIKAVIIIHEFGYPARIKEIATIAKKYDLILIEDAACALGTIADGYHVGHYSDAACFSFHPRKGITTGEGGAIISNNRELIDYIKIFRNHGVKTINGKIEFNAAGLNYRMTDFQASLAVGQFNRFSKEIAKRKKLVEYYYDYLANEQLISIPKNNEGHSWQSFMIVVDERVHRDDLIEKMLNNGVQTNLGAYSLNCLHYFRHKYDLDEHSFPIATKLYKQGLVLPIYGKLKASDIHLICEKLRAVL